jgi:hypothetical protein
MRRRVRVLVFNVKGEDLLHLDRPNARYAARPDREELDRRWAALGLAEPGPFPSVGVWAPPRPDGAANAASRQEDVRAFGWTPYAFAVEGLLRFCFTEAADMRNQLSFLEERVRGELLRRAAPVQGHPGALGSWGGPGRGRARHAPGARRASWPRAPSTTSASLSPGWVTELDDEGRGGRLNRPRRLRRSGLHPPARERGREAARARAPDAEPIPRGAAAQNEPPSAVVHLARLHDFAQRFVVGTPARADLRQRRRPAREPIELRADELNKYAPREGTPDQGHS